MEEATQEPGVPPRDMLRIGPAGVRTSARPGARPGFQVCSRLFGWTRNPRHRFSFFFNKEQGKQPQIAFLGRAPP